jgi:serine protease Do
VRSLSILLTTLVVFAAGSAGVSAQPQPIPSSFARAAAAIRPAVYGLEVPTRDENQESEGLSASEFMRKFFGELPEGKLGAAFMTDASGVAVTSARLVRGLTDVELVSLEGERSPATVIGRDERTDIAVLRVRTTRPLPSAALGNSDEVRIGEWVLAVGSPYGFEASVSAGIISGRPRVSPDGDYEDSLQTDAAVNPGSLGGPLVNAQGVVVGLTVTTGPRGSGIGFAVPANVVRRVTAELIARGKVLRGWLGIVSQAMTPELAHAFGVPVTGGVLAADVFRDGPAARAGIQRGALLLALDDRMLRTPADVETHLARTAPGQRVTVRLWRDSHEETLVIVLGDEPVRFEKSLRAERVLGLLVDALTPEAGVVVVAVRPGSGAAAAEVSAGDIIREIDRHAVMTLSEFERATKRLAPGGDVTVLVQRGPRTFYVVVPALSPPTLLGDRPQHGAPTAHSRSRAVLQDRELSTTGSDGRDAPNCSGGTR